MALSKRQLEYRQRWGERIKTVSIAALSAVAARASAEDIPRTVVSIVILVGVGEMVAEWYAVQGYRKRLRDLAKQRARNRAIRSTHGAGSKKKSSGGSARK